MGELLKVVDDERVTARFVRFLIAEGVIPAPRGGRSNADYGEDHLTGVHRYLRLRDFGLSASRSKAIIAGTASGGVPVPVGPGLTLIVDPEKLDGPVHPRQIAARIEAAVDLIVKKDD